MKIEMNGEKRNKRRKEGDKDKYEEGEGDMYG